MEANRFYAGPVTMNPTAMFTGEQEPWSHKDLKIQLLLDLEGDHPVFVWVIDSGIAPHEDLIVHSHYNKSGSSGAVVNPHGTHVAGIIAAQHNGKGTKGLNPFVKLMDGRVLGPDGSGSNSNIVDMLQLVETTAPKLPGRHIVSMSLGGPANVPQMEASINRLYNTGILTITAAGNSGQAGAPNLIYPAKYDKTLAVGSYSPNQQPSSFSSHGDMLQIMAPGDGILSTVPGGYQNFSGTSMATPAVSAIVAHMLRLRPELSPAQVVAILKDTAIDMNAPGRDIYTGWGRINVEGIVKKLDVTKPVEPPVVEPPANKDIKKLLIGAKALIDEALNEL